MHKKIGLNNGSLAGEAGIERPSPTPTPPKKSNKKNGAQQSRWPASVGVHVSLPVCLSRTWLPVVLGLFTLILLLHAGITTVFPPPGVYEPSH